MKGQSKNPTQVLFAGIAVMLFIAAFLCALVTALYIFKGQPIPPDGWTTGGAGLISLSLGIWLKMFARKVKL